MANLIFKDSERERVAGAYLDSYGIDGRDPVMRDAAEIAAARQEEAIRRVEADNERRYFV